MGVSLTATAMRSEGAERIRMGKNGDIGEDDMVSTRAGSALVWSVVKLLKTRHSRRGENPTAMTCPTT